MPVKWLVRRTSVCDHDHVLLLDTLMTLNLLRYPTPSPFEISWHMRSTHISSSSATLLVSSMKPFTVVTQMGICEMDVRAAASKYILRGIYAIRVSFF